MTTDYAPNILYLDYLQRRGVAIEAAGQAATLAARVNWDEPETAADYQGTAVLAFIEAEQAEDLETRRLYFDLALQALEAAIATGEPSLAPAQWAIAQSLLGNLSKTAQVAFNELIAASASAFEMEQDPCQLVYLPAPGPGSSGAIASELLPELLGAAGLGAQRLLLAAEALCRGNLVLYNPGGGRSLQILAQLIPNSVSLNRKLGIYQLANQALEGFLWLDRSLAQATSASDPSHTLRTVTALQLAAQTYQSATEVEAWQQRVRAEQSQMEKLWPVWAEPDSAVPCVYVPYDEDICFAAEPTLNSIVTRVLLAEGDWFEHEMELWRYLIKPGMTVIDVGANSGVYTFSAAKRVGETGKVIAIEPFQGCVTCLRETSRKNNFPWVKVCEAAASHKPGELFLNLHGASELNEIQSIDVAPSGNFQKVDCITLDSLIALENLTRVDLIKIDAEGHETAVLQGAAQMIAQFSPILLYENLAGSQGSNIEMAQALLSQDYSLFSYRAFASQLSPVANEDELGQFLNVIAVPQQRVSEFSKFITS